MKCGRCGLKSQIPTDCAGLCGQYEERIPILPPNATTTASNVKVCLPKKSTGTDDESFDTAAIPCDGQVGSDAKLNK